jgi:hypothetical protein
MIGIPVGACRFEISCFSAGFWSSASAVDFWGDTCLLEDRPREDACFALDRFDPDFLRVLPLREVDPRADSLGA